MEKGRITFDFTNMFSEAIGGHGLDREAIDRAGRAIPAVHSSMEEKRAAMAWRALPYNQREILVDILAAGQRIREECDDFVVLGIGGSALGSKALFSACCHPRYNLLPKEKRGGPRFHVEDNVDPDKLLSLLDIIDLPRAAFHVISKSGSTVETMSQFILILHLLKERLGEDFARHLYLTTDAAQGVLRKTAWEQKWSAFIVPEGVGGRFSVLSPVGLLSAAALGLDVEALLAGAAHMDGFCSQPSLELNPAYMYALLYTEAMKQGVNISVLLPYAEALAPLAEWYGQLWAESLGKRLLTAEGEIRWGQTPVRAVGVTDQHSQIQLYNEGPFDKIITFMGLENFRSTLTIPVPPLPLPDLAYLYGHTFNELLENERQATQLAVSANGKLNNTILVERLNEFTLGGLFFFFEMATAAAGELLGINAFDQPGVEEGKISTYALMGRPGYEERGEELRRAASGPSCSYQV